MSEETDVERADRIVERLLKEKPGIHQVVADARMFSDLRESPGWQRLFTMVQAKKGRWMEQISVRLMGPKKSWPEPDEIAYYQGFYQGAIFVLSHPEHAEKNLEKAARLAWSLYGGDDSETEED